MDGQERFYGELARWWPLLSPVADYEEEAAEVVRHLRTAAIPVGEVLELGSGGGHLASWARAAFRMTLVDLSPGMVEVSRATNPGCEHHVGDLRTVRLGRTFDAVLLHDAVEYMTTEADLLAAFRTAFEHCRPGGVVVAVPDHTLESFEPSCDHGGSDAPDGRGARLLEWSIGPTATDPTVRTDYVLVLREADGSVRTVHDEHHTGLFATATWLRLLEEAGFRAEARIEETTEDREPRTIFVGHRPA